MSQLDSVHKYLRSRELCKELGMAHMTPKGMWIGVGRALAPPSLRTGQALFTHPALQLMGSNSETEVFEF